jgi:hypothetical protein
MVGATGSAARISLAPPRYGFGTKCGTGTTATSLSVALAERRQQRTPNGS